jgi:hypothetical protein
MAEKMVQMMVVMMAKLAVFWMAVSWAFQQAEVTDRVMVKKMGDQVVDTRVLRKDENKVA